jgi:DNA-directed RNA polymerase subunit RPC12/RpoP
MKIKKVKQYQYKCFDCGAEITIKSKRRYTNSDGNRCPKCNGGHYIPVTEI